MVPEYQNMKKPIFKDIYKYLTKCSIPSPVKGDTLKRLKTECEDYIVIDNVLFRIKRPKDTNIKPSLLILPETYVPIKPLVSIP